MPTEPACAGWRRLTVDLGTAEGLQATFTKGAGAWDNNGANHRLGTGVSAVRDGTVSREDPCATAEPDTRPPSVPTGLTARAEGVGVVLRWDPATDDTGYQVTRTGGSGGPFVTDARSTDWSEQDWNRAPSTGTRCAPRTPRATAPPPPPPSR